MYTIWHLCDTPVLDLVLSPLQCSKSCGSGHRRRALQCVDHNQQEVHEMYCVNQIRPPDIESCNTHVCEFIWITGEWTEVRAKPAVCHLPDAVPLEALRSIMVENHFALKRQYFTLQKDRSCKSPSLNPVVQK